VRRSRGTRTNTSSCWTPQRAVSIFCFAVACHFSGFSRLFGSIPHADMRHRRSEQAGIGKLNAKVTEGAKKLRD
jgi:hypothetical protein